MSAAPDMFCSPGVLWGVALSEYHIPGAIASLCWPCQGSIRCCSSWWSNRADEAGFTRCGCLLLGSSSAGEALSCGDRTAAIFQETHDVSLQQRVVSSSTCTGWCHLRFSSCKICHTGREAMSLLICVTQRRRKSSDCSTVLFLCALGLVQANRVVY